MPFWVFRTPLTARGNEPVRKLNGSSMPLDFRLCPTRARSTVARPARRPFSRIDTQGSVTPAGMRSLNSYCRYEFTSVSVIGVVAGVFPRPRVPLAIRSSLACRRAASRRDTGSAATRLQTNRPVKRADMAVRLIALLSYLNGKALVAVYRNWRGGRHVMFQIEQTM